MVGRLSSAFRDVRYNEVLWKRMDKLVARVVFLDRWRWQCMEGESCFS
jgi:hypothetical protein